MAMASKLGNVLLSLALLVALHGLSLSFLGSGPARVESPRAARSVARHAEDDDEVGGLGGLMRLHIFFENLSLSLSHIYIYIYNIIYTDYIQIKIRSRNLHTYIYIYIYTHM